MKKILSFSLAVTLLASTSWAQPQGERPAPPQMKNPSDAAKELADLMQKEVQLDKKQYKKIYSLYKKDFQYRQKAAQENMPEGMPPQGGGPGMGGPGGMGGGMPGGMGGGMMGGGPGGMGGGMMGGGPGMGGGMSGGGMPQGQRPEGGPGMGPESNPVDAEYIEKQEAKLRKILTPEQYGKWRAKHPIETLEIPDLPGDESR